MMARKLIALAAAGVFLAAIGPASAQAQSASDLQRLAEYKHRVTLLEDEVAIENLQATFGFYFDKGLWDQAAALFTRNGTFEYEQMGVYIGPERIRRAMLLFGPQGLTNGHLNNHMMLQNIIVVAKDGKTATARWQGPIMLSEPARTGEWGVGIYENEYVKEGGVWKISKLHFYLTAKTDYDLGFGKSWLPVRGQSALFPPDRPPSEVYRALPAAHLPQFSFDHPVTGQPLKNLPAAGDDVVGRPAVGMEGK